MAPLSIIDVRKSFGATPVIRGVSVDIGDGEFVTLVGPSGCGKSTLLRMIAGLETVTDGEIRLGGRVVNDLQPKERDVAMVFQNYALYPHMTVAQNMGFALKLAGMPKPQIGARVARAADVLGLAALMGRTPRELSGGQRQRVAMGRAIVRDPKVFLFDEPLSNLDAKLRVQMRAEIKELHQTLRTTTVYVTHDQIEAMTMADRIVVMNAGVVEQIGAPLDLYDRPADLFVAGFIGSPGMNLLPGRIEDGAFRADAGLTLPLPPHAGAVVGQRCVYGFRPEHVALAAGGIEGRVAVVEPTGSESLVVLRVGPAQVTCLFRERIAAAPGATLAVRPDPAAAHLFDEATGRRLPDRDAPPRVGAPSGSGAGA